MSLPGAYTILRLTCADPVIINQRFAKWKVLIYIMRQLIGIQ